MERGSPRRIAWDIAGVLAALAAAEASREKFIVAGGLLTGALLAATWGLKRARPTRAPRTQDRTLAHPLRWACLYLVTIGPATFYLTYDGVFHSHHVAAAVGVSLAVAGLVFLVRWVLVRRSPPG